MKYYVFASLLLAIAVLPGFQCEKNRDLDSCYKGRLEIKGMCMNYTIKLLEGQMDTSLFQAAWKDEQTGISYTNVFRLGSVCTFPAGLKEGDEFYFRIERGAKKMECLVCMAYYPTPAKALNILVSDSPCK
jgi:hypothetical protein